MRSPWRAAIALTSSAEPWTMTSTGCCPISAATCLRRLSERRARGWAQSGAAAKSRTASESADRTARRSGRRRTVSASPDTTYVLRFPTILSCLAHMAPVCGRALRFLAVRAPPQADRGLPVLVERRHQHALRSADGADGLQLAFANAVVDGAPRDLKERGGLIDRDARPSCCSNIS